MAVRDVWEFDDTSYELEYEQKVLAEPRPTCGVHSPIAAETPTTPESKDLVD